MSKENPLANYIWGLAIKQRSIATRVNMAYPGISIIALAIEQTLKQIVEQRNNIPSRITYQNPDQHNLSTLQHKYKIGVAN